MEAQPTEVVSETISNNIDDQNERGEEVRLEVNVQETETLCEAFSNSVNEQMESVQQVENGATYSDNHSESLQEPQEAEFDTETNINEVSVNNYQDDLAQEITLQEAECDAGINFNHVAMNCRTNEMVQELPENVERESSEISVDDQNEPVGLNQGYV